jgi:hypothetical protein
LAVAYYPVYDSYDPIPLKDRGLWFSGQAYSILYPHEKGVTPVVISPYHTWQSCLFTFADQGTIYASLGDIVYALKLGSLAVSITIGSTTVVSAPLVRIKQWTYLAVNTYSTRTDARTEIKFYNQRRQEDIQATQHQIKMRAKDVEGQTIGAIVHYTRKEATHMVFRDSMDICGN